MHLFTIFLFIYSIHSQCIPIQNWNFIPEPFKFTLGRSVSSGFYIGRVDLPLKLRFTFTFTPASLGDLNLRNLFAFSIDHPPTILTAPITETFGSKAFSIHQVPQSTALRISAGLFSNYSWGFDTPALPLNAPTVVSVELNPSLALVALNGSAALSVSIPDNRYTGPTYYWNSHPFMNAAFGTIQNVSLFTIPT